MRTISILIILFLVGCAKTQPTVHGIPNFGIVVSPKDGIVGIYCGGEPTSEGNTFLHSLDVTRQVKLNSELDVPGTDKQFEVVAVPITTGQQIFGNGLFEAIPKAASAIQPGTFVHCEHGKNRTQTVIGYWLVSKGIPKEQAQKQMERYGWGDSLPGLKWYWNLTNK